MLVEHELAIIKKSGQATTRDGKKKKHMTELDKFFWEKL